jgi:branched-chain amino acid transport system substrate-binding protein
MTGRSHPGTRFLAMFAVFAIVLAACSPGATGSGPVASSSASGGTGTSTLVHLFGIASLTGPSRSSALAVQQAAELAVKQINDAGGVKDANGNSYTFDINRNDMDDSKSDAIALGRQAGSDTKYLAIIGPNTSLGFVPLVPVVGDLHILMFGAGTLAHVDTWNPWAFRINATVETGLPVFIKQLVTKLSIKHMAILFDQTQDFQKGAAEQVKTLGAELGYSTDAYQAFNAKDQDFSAQLTAITAANPDGIFIAAQPGDAAKIAGQMADKNITTPVLTSSSDFLNPEVWDGSNGKTKGWYSYTSVNTSNPEPQVKTIMDAYAAMFPGTDFNDQSAYGYAAVYAIAEAIKNAGSADRDAVRQAMDKLSYTTPLGTSITYQNPPDGENKTAPVVSVQITGRTTFDTVK